MGTYTEFSIAGYTVLSTKNAVMPEVMTVFRETDRREDKQNSEDQNTIEYACEISKAIDRLNVMGFTLPRIKRDFEKGRQSELHIYLSWIDIENPEASHASEISFFKSLTFDTYLKELATVLEKNITSSSTYQESSIDLSPLQKHIIGENDEYLLGFFANDIRCAIRAACEAAPKDQYVIQNISALVDGGYYNADAKVCTEAIEALITGYPENSAQIILTEGSTDALILRQALDLLYPHLSGYYSFFDFNSTRPPGGAGHLMTLVKAFAATGITNRVIALFDNDTAAHDALRALKQIQLPKNIVVLNYPELEILSNYPTRGPYGEINSNVNGLAASIELYLGADILRQPNGSFTPVQWKGYNETLRQYQGEVMQKTKLQQSFNLKATAVLTKQKSIDLEAWSGLDSILKIIFTAFDNETESSE